MAELRPPEYSNHLSSAVPSSSQSLGLLASLNPADSAPPVLLNLAPLHGASFQTGHLGVSNERNGEEDGAHLEGEVQVKFVGAETEVRPAFSRLEIVFRGVEKKLGKGGMEVVLCEEKKVLWEAAPRRDGDLTGEGNGFPPSSVVWKLALTFDLPHCVHQTHSSISYTLTATLTPLSPLSPTSPTLSPIVKSAELHLTRYSPPGSTLSPGNSSLLSTIPNDVEIPSLSPQFIENTAPFTWTAELERNVFFSGEPINLTVRIGVPSVEVVEKYQLRMIGAELIRKVKVSRNDEGGGEEEEEEEKIMVMRRSGKSCRFSPTKGILIRLVLHTQGAASCESISQSTILHTISFSLRVTVGLFHSSPNPTFTSTSTSASCSTWASPSPSRQEFTVTRSVYLIPNPPAVLSYSKQLEAESSSSQARQDHGPVPRYEVEGNGESSTSGTALAAFHLGDEEAPWEEESEPPYVWEEDPRISEGNEESHEDDVLLEGNGEEVEYDGYEDLSESMSRLAPPPTIDEDTSPPGALLASILDPPPSVDDPFDSVPPESRTGPRGSSLLPPNDFNTEAGALLSNSQLSAPSQHIDPSSTNPPTPTLSRAPSALGLASSSPHLPPTQYPTSTTTNATLNPNPNDINFSALDHPGAAPDETLPPPYGRTTIITATPPPYSSTQRHAAVLVGPGGIRVPMDEGA